MSVGITKKILLINIIMNYNLFDALKNLCENFFLKKFDNFFILFIQDLMKSSDATH